MWHLTPSDHRASGSLWAWRGGRCWGIDPGIRLWSDCGAHKPTAAGIPPLCMWGYQKSKERAVLGSLVKGWGYSSLQANVALEWPVLLLRMTINGKCSTSIVVSGIEPTCTIIYVQLGCINWRSWTDGSLPSWNQSNQNCPLFCSN